MAQPLLPSEHDPVATHDHIVHLHDVSWADYERLLEIRGEHSAPRYTYLEGELEIMSPSKTHEAVKSVIGCLVEVWCLENGVEFSTLGSWTVKDRDVQRGAEPDECYIFGNAQDRVAPDLAIEVVWTSGGINKLDVYRKLGVNEVWYWSRGRIDVYLLRDEQYELAPVSQALRGIDLRQLERFVDQPTTSAAMLAYRAALRG
jgi:Uma2 family endonuclease